MRNMSLIIIVCLSVFLAQLGITLSLPALPILSQVYSSQPQEITLSLAMYLTGMAAPMLLWGSLAEKYGRKNLLKTSLLLYLLCCLAIVFNGRLDVFLLLRFFQGIAASGMSVIARIAIRDRFSGNQLAQALSWLSIAFVVSLGIGQYLGALLLAAFGWQAIFLSLAVMAATILLATFLISLPEPSIYNGSHGVIARYWTILTCRHFLMPTLAGGLGYGIIIIFNTNGPFIFQHALNWSASQYGLLGWPISLSYFVGAVLVNRLVLTKGNKGLVLLGSGCLLIGCSGMLIGGIIKLSWLLWLPYCLIVIGQGIIYPISMAIANQMSPLSGGYSMALCGFIHQLMAAGVGVFASRLSNSPIWLSSACICLFAVWACIALKYSVQGWK